MSKLVQRQIDFTRGEQLSLRREICLPPGEKFLLWILDDHIGSGRSWVMSMAQLQAESGFGKTATYGYVNRLCERGLVWWDELADKRREFRICWPNVAETIEASSPRELPVRQTNGAVRHAESQFATRTASSPDEQPCSPRELHILNMPSLTPPTTPLQRHQRPRARPPQMMAMTRRFARRRKTRRNPERSVGKSSTS